MAEQDKTSAHEEVVIVNPCGNPSHFVYHLEFDLGIGEEWLPKHPVARVSTSMDVLNHDDFNY